MRSQTVHAFVDPVARFCIMGPMPLASCRSRGPTVAALAVGPFLLCAFLLLFHLSSTALAQPSDDERARGHFNAGASYFDQRRYDLAAREFEEAFRLSDRPALLLNLSTTYERLDQLDRAAESLEQYLQREPTSPQRRTLEIRLEELRRQLREQAAAPPAETTPATPAPSAPSSGPSGLLIGSLVSLGAAAIFGGVAIGTGLVSNDRLAQLQAECGPERMCPPGLDGVIDEGETMALVSTVFTFAGIAAAIAGATLLTLELTSGSSEQQPTARASLWGGPAGGGVRFDLAF